VGAWGDFYIAGEANWLLYSTAMNGENGNSLRAQSYGCVGEFEQKVTRRPTGDWLLYSIAMKRSEMATNEGDMNLD